MHGIIFTSNRAKECAFELHTHLLGWSQLFPIRIIIKIAHALASLYMRASCGMLMMRRSQLWPHGDVKHKFAVPNGSSFTIPTNMTGKLWHVPVAFNVHRLSVVLITYLPQTIARSTVWFLVYIRKWSPLSLFHLSAGAHVYACKWGESSSARAILVKSCKRYKLYRCRA